MYTLFISVLHGHVSTAAVTPSASRITSGGKPPPFVLTTGNALVLSKKWNKWNEINELRESSVVSGPLSKKNSGQQQRHTLAQVFRSPVVRVQRVFSALQFIFSEYQSSLLAWCVACESMPSLLIQGTQHAFRIHSSLIRKDKFFVNFTHNSAN